MHSKIVSLTTIFGIFALTAFLFTQTLADFQTSFGAKGGEHGCGDNQKAIESSGGNCVKNGDCDDVISGGCTDNEGNNDNNQGCQQCSDP